MPALLSIISFLISLHHQLVSCQYLRLTFVHTSLFLFFLEDSLYCLDASAHPFISNLIAAHIRERKKEKCFYSLQNSQHPAIMAQTTQFGRLFLKDTCITYGLSMHIRHISSKKISCVSLGSVNGQTNASVVY